MADIEVVIKLSEQDYELACKYPDVLFGSYGRAIAKGTPLPKGHGRLIDADELNNSLRGQERSYEHTFGIRQPINEAVKDGLS